MQYYDVPKAPEPISSPAAHIYLSNLGEAEKAYYQFVTSGEKNFVDAAYEVAKNKQVIQVFTAGNRSMMAESFTRAMLPYFRPDAEKSWVNVTGQVGGEGYPNDSNDDVSDEKQAQIFKNLTSPAIQNGGRLRRHPPISIPPTFNYKTTILMVTLFTNQLVVLQWLPHM
ncbi:MAG: hypothetical protein ACLR5Y_08180 [Haemophilus parainfluenzae]